MKFPTAVQHPDSAEAQRLLNAAETVVRNVFVTLLFSRAIDRTLTEKDLRGRLKEPDTDLLRTMIAFAGAGLDAALKELIRSTVRDLIQINKACRDKFKEFVKAHLAAGAPLSVDRGRLVEILIDGRTPQEALFDAYERDLTGGSLQSVDKVNEVCGALGVNDPSLRKRLHDGGTLDLMFNARNKIVHQLDLESGGERTARYMQEAWKYTREALTVAQLIINDVGKALPRKVVAHDQIIELGPYRGPAPARPRPRGARADRAHRKHK